MRKLLMAAFVLLACPYGYGQSISDQPYKLFLIQADLTKDPAKTLTGMGCHINTKAGNIWSVSIPTSRIGDVKSTTGVIDMSGASPIRPAMDDSSRRLVRVNEVHQGDFLPTAYKGKDVVVGIIDVGFDYTHKAFFDANGNCRIKRVWEQSKAGNSPTGFSYGNELATDFAIKAARYDRTDFSHGNLVAGIAAGSKASARSTGMAPEADIVLVSLNYGNNDYYSDMNIAPAKIADGIRYIFDYAESVGKPAVVNISWGHHAGPHDGTGLLDLAIENMTDTGRIVVVAAGNERLTRLHVSKELNNDTAYTYSLYDDWAYTAMNNSGIGEKNMNDFWGSPGSSFSLKLQWRDLNGNLVAESPFMESAANHTFDSMLFLGGDTLAYQVTCNAANPRNNKPQIFVDFSNNAPAKYRVCYGIYAVQSTVHGWNCGSAWQFSYGNFIDRIGNNILAKGVTGDNAYTVGESGGNCKEVITVGAYTSNTNWLMYTGSSIDFGQPENDLAVFSSYGPTTGNHMKPDLTAPGYYIGGPFNKFATQQPSLYLIYDRIMRGSTVDDYEMTTGTSMAAPVVTGAIALMLEADPTLTPERVKTILQQSAINDEYTGNVKSAPTAVWGAGKLNTLQAVRDVLNLTGINNKENRLNFNAYPNPFRNRIELTLPDAIHAYTVRLIDMQGRVITTATYSSAEKATFDVSGITDGIYLLQVSNGEQTGTIKVTCMQ